MDDMAPPMIQRRTGSVLDYGSKSPKVIKVGTQAFNFYTQLTESFLQLFQSSYITPNLMLIMDT